MIKIISPDQFKKIPWKNGKGDTSELAISKEGTLADFDWRLSMASVVEDGKFSDFTGYRRNLIYKANTYRAILNTYTDSSSVTLVPCTLCFIYCLNEAASLTSNTINISLLAGHLMQVIVSESDCLQVNGKNMIVIHLTALDT